MAKKNTIPSGYVLVEKKGYHIREDGNTFAKSLGIANVGDRISYLGKTVKGWHKVSFEGTTGYLYRQAGTLVTVQLRSRVVKKGNWNVRSAPSSSADILGKVSGGDLVLDQGEIKNKYRLVVFGNQNAWLPINAFEKE